MAAALYFWTRSSACYLGEMVVQVVSNYWRVRFRSIMSVRMFTNLLMNRCLNMNRRRGLEKYERNKPLIEYMPDGIQSVERR
jgi:hypothetical protein